jgi:glycosyltransferase involved in cell wall biosynthesis
LQIVPALETGGAERSTIEIAEALAREGFLPLVASQGGRMVGELEAVGGEWIAMPLNTKSPAAILANAGRLSDLIRARNIPLVHARSRAPAWSALLATRRTHVPFVTTHHGIYTARTPWKRLYNSVMVRGDAVIANSRWTAEHIQSSYGKLRGELVTIPRGIEPSRFDPARIAREQVLVLRAGWDAGHEDIVVLLPGRLTRLKGQAVLIAAIRKLKRRANIDHVRVILAGDAQGREDYAQELKQAIVGSGLDRVVRIVGHVEDMPAAYAASDIVVSASTQAESFGRTLAEASAMERPVIGTDHGGARETVRPGLSGQLVPPGDAMALARALQEMIQTSPASRAAMGAKGRAHILAHFSVAAMTEATLALYRKLLRS